LLRAGVKGGEHLVSILLEAEGVHAFDPSQLLQRARRGARHRHQHRVGSDHLHLDLARRGIALRIVGARGRVRDLLRAEGIGEKVGGLDRLATLDDLLGGAGR